MRRWEGRELQAFPWIPSSAFSKLCDLQHDILSLGISFLFCKMGMTLVPLELWGEAKTCKGSNIK